VPEQLLTLLLVRLAEVVFDPVSGALSPVSFTGTPVDCGAARATARALLNHHDSYSMKAKNLHALSNLKHSAEANA